MDTPPYDLISWEDAPLRPLRPYNCYDVDGLEVIINPKNPAVHLSNHPLQDEPAVFHNLKIVVSEPDSVVPATPSLNPTSILNRQKGKVVVYSKSSLLGGIDFPGYPTINDEVKVMMLYPHDGATPYSLTYRIGP